jgi:Icc protein
VLAGDLTDLGQPAAYEHLKSIIARLPIPVHITLGNHDDRPSFLAAFGSDFAAETGKVDKVIDIKGYRVILLDSSEPGRVDGVLEETQIAWLRARLAEAADRPVIVILHHNANALHINADNIRILEPDASSTRSRPIPTSARSSPATCISPPPPPGTACPSPPWPAAIIR